MRAFKIVCLGIAIPHSDPYGARNVCFIAGYQVDTFRLYLTRHTLMNSLFGIDQNKKARNTLMIFRAFVVKTR